MILFFPFSLRSCRPCGYLVENGWPHPTTLSFRASSKSASAPCGNFNIILSKIIFFLNTINFIYSHKASATRMRHKILLDSDGILRWRRHTRTHLSVRHISVDYRQSRAAGCVDQSKCPGQHSGHTCPTPCRPAAGGQVCYHIKTIHFSRKLLTNCFPIYVGSYWYRPSWVWISSERFGHFVIWCIVLRPPITNSRRLSLKVRKAQNVSILARISISKDVVENSNI